MKKQVDVCDGDEGLCRSLADRACPLCEKDFCLAHFKPELFVQICVRQQGLSQPGQAPFAPGAEKYDMHNVQELHIGICRGCYIDLERLQRGKAPKYTHTQILAALAADLPARLVETCRAGLAAAKLDDSGT